MSDRRARDRAKRTKDNKLALPFAALVFIMAVTFIIDKRAFVGEFCVVLFLFLVLLISRAGSNTKWSRFVGNMMTDLKVAARRSLLDVPLPVVVLRKNGEIIWANEMFAEQAGNPSVFGRNIDEFARGLSVRKLDKDALYSGFEAVMGDSAFKVCGTYAKAGREESGEQFLVLYFIDQTDNKMLNERYEACRPTVSIIVIDNIEELSAVLSENERATVISKIENIYTEWAARSEGIFRSTERGKYIYICESRHMDDFINAKFDVLDRVRGIAVSGRLPVSISIGVGKDGASYAENNAFAKQAIDMALGRGGDQAVIKTRHNYEYYGGKSKAVEKRTKVKSRIMASALSDLLDRCSNVLVMGHKYADFDSVGACVGIARAAFVKRRPVNIVVNRETVLSLPLIESLERLPEYEGIFIDPSAGQDLITSRTLLVICDTHNRHYVESGDILDNCGSVAIIDHHRKMAEFIEDTVLFYHEPFASSACEIVAELVQYIDGNGTLMSEEAEAILAGIVLDTKNFYFKTGFRTFEAAAYLRKAGADLIALKRLFKNDYLTFIRKTELISAAQFYRENIALSVWEGERLQGAKVIMSQAADELLNIENVDASFVLYAGSDGVHISARSLGTVNVQLILEKLGGGGHLTTAGAQVEGPSEQVLQKLKKAIDKYFEEQE